MNIIFNIIIFIYNVMDVSIFYNDNGILIRNKLRESWVKKHMNNLYNSIINYNLPKDISHFSQKIYHYIHNMYDYPTCEYCKHDNKRYQSFSTGYLDFCCKSCALSHIRPQIEITRRINTLIKHGVRHTSMLYSTKLKQKESNEIIYGYISPVCNESVQLKTKRTNIDRYDVEYVMQNVNMNYTIR